MTETSSSGKRKHLRLQIRTAHSADAESAIWEAEKARRERIRVISDRLSTVLWAVMAVCAAYIALAMWGVIDTAVTGGLAQTMTIAGGIIALCCVAGLLAVVLEHRARRSGGNAIAESRAARGRTSFVSEPNRNP